MKTFCVFQTFHFLLFTCILSSANYLWLIDKQCLSGPNSDFVKSVMIQKMAYHDNMRIKKSKRIILLNTVVYEHGQVPSATSYIKEKFKKKSNLFKVVWFERYFGEYQEKKKEQPSWIKPYTSMVNSTPFQLLDLRPDCRWQCLKTERFEKKKKTFFLIFRKILTKIFQLKFLVLPFKL